MLTVTVDKFTFRVPEDLLYSSAGVWVRVDGTLATLGLSDFAQRVSGDIAFANIRPPGTELAIGDEFGSIETVKVNLELSAPDAGKVIEVNPLLESAPELINQDPYGQGWMVRIELERPDSAASGLLDAHGYLDLVRNQAEAELNK